MNTRPRKQGSGGAEEEQRSREAGKNSSKRRRGQENDKKGCIERGLLDQERGSGNIEMAKKSKKKWLAFMKNPIVNEQLVGKTRHSWAQQE